VDRGGWQSACSARRGKLLTGLASLAQASDIYQLFRTSQFSTALLKTLWKRCLNVTQRLRIGRAFNSLHQPVAS
jgi:hypothetical protein